MRRHLEHLTKILPLALALAVMSACSGVEVTEPESGLPSSGPELPIGGIGGDSTVSFNDPALVGSWTRVLLFTDAAGTQRGSQLTFSFSSDSTFTRRLVTSTFTPGSGETIVDAVVERGRWSTQGGAVTLRYNPGLEDERVSRFSYRIARRSDGNQVLLLNDSGFART